MSDNPSLVNEPDVKGVTPLEVAVDRDLVDLVEWLVDEKGACVNRVGQDRSTPLHAATSCLMITTLLERGAEPSLPNSSGFTVLMERMADNEYGCVIRLLKYASARATVNAQACRGGLTVLHIAADPPDDDGEGVCGAMIELLLRNGSDTTIRDSQGRTALGALDRKIGNDTYHPANLMARQVPDAKKAALLVKARRLFILAAQGSPSLQVAPTYLQSRTEQGKAWPRVEMASATDAEDGSEEDQAAMEQQRRLQTAVCFCWELTDPRERPCLEGCL